MPASGCFIWYDNSMSQTTILQWCVDGCRAGPSPLQDAEKYKAKVSSLNVSLAEILHKFPGLISGWCTWFLTYMFNLKALEQSRYRCGILLVSCWKESAHLEIIWNHLNTSEVCLTSTKRALEVQGLRRCPAGRICGYRQADGHAPLQRLIVPPGSGSGSQCGHCHSGTSEVHHGHWKAHGF